MITKRYIKKRLLKFKILKHIFEKKEYKYRIKRFSAICSTMLGSEDFYILGYNKSTKLINRNLKKLVNKECKAFIIKNEDQIEEISSHNLISMSDIIMMDNINEIRIIIQSSRTIISDIESLLDIGIDWNQMIIDEDWGKNIGGKGFDSYDLMLGYQRLDDLPGFSIFEDKSKERVCTIVTLGGSTTDPYTGNVKSWSEFLFYKLSDMGINVKIICGGVSAYHSRQEVQKLIRDVLPMKPDIVISYSGINDTEYFQMRHVSREYPDFMLFQMEFNNYAMRKALKKGYFLGARYSKEIDNCSYGIKNKDDFATRWINNERIMNSICTEFGIKFYSILQPCRDYGGYIKTEKLEKATFKRNLEYNIQTTIKFYEDVRNNIAKYDFIIDFSNLFNNQTNIFYDYCHVFEKGNRVIATAILKEILPEVRKKIKETRGCS